VVALASTTVVLLDDDVVGAVIIIFLLGLWLFENAEQKREPSFLWLTVKWIEKKQVDDRRCRSSSSKNGRDETKQKPCNDCCLTIIIGLRTKTNLSKRFQYCLSLNDTNKQWWQRNRNIYNRMTMMMQSKMGVKNIVSQSKGGEWKGSRKGRRCPQTVSQRSKIIIMMNYTRDDVKHGETSYCWRVT
jgi:hypothetical protein